MVYLIQKRAILESFLYLNLPMDFWGLMTRVRTWNLDSDSPLFLLVSHYWRLVRCCEVEGGVNEVSHCQCSQFHGVGGMEGLSQE